jgi:hypothetical protein
MTKSEAVKALYGAEPTFSFDTALPQPLLDDITNVVTGYYKWLKGDEIAVRRDKTYTTVLSGCVYAECKNSGNSGLLPLTDEARRTVQHYAELIVEQDALQKGRVERFFHIFTPSLNLYES